MLIPWWLLIELIGLIAFPVAFVVCRRFSDRGFGLSKALGLLLIAYPTWILACLHLVSFSRRSILLSLFLLLLLSAYLVWKNQDELMRFLKSNWKLLVWVEVAFLAAFILMAEVRMRNPEVSSRWMGYGSEKMMDMNFVNSIMRSETFPPQDNWFHGRTINYYWYGYYLTAFMTMLTGYPSEYTYNLMVITLFGMAFVGCFSIGTGLTRRKLCGAFLAIILLVLGNLKGALVLWQKKGADFGPSEIWSCSRVIDLPTDRTINEFPYFSFLWGDLHGHLVSLPFGILLIGLLANIAWFGARRKDDDAPVSSVWTVPLIALVLGAVASVSSWDLPTYSLLTLGAALAFVGPGRLWDWVKEIGFRVVAVAGGVVLYLPFYLNFIAPTGGLPNKVAQKSTPQLILLIFGLLLFLALTFLVVQCARLKKPKWVGIDTIVVVALFIAAVVAGYRNTHQWVVGPLAVLLLLAIYLYVKGWNGSMPTGQRFALALIGLSLCIIIGCEFVAMADFYGESSARMNTVFKFHFQAWTYLCVAGALALGLILDSRCLGWGSRIARYAWCVALIALVLAGSVFTYKATKAKTNKWQNKPTLNGLAYMNEKSREEYAPGDYAAIQWLKEETKGFRGANTPIVLELCGDPYSQYSRFSTFTGLPSLMGWSNHEDIWHRKDPGEKPGPRTSIVKGIYENINFGQARKSLDENKIQYVAVGKFEREKIGVPELGKFDKYMNKVFDQDGTSIYSGYLEPERKDYPDEELPIDKKKPAKRLTADKFWGSRGDGPGQFMEIRGIAVGPDGSVYVVDPPAERVQKFAAEGEFISSWGGTKGSEPGQFQEPHGIAVEPDGNVLVADTWNHRIQRFDKDGTFITSWTGDFWAPRDLDVDPQGNVYVSDTGKCEIKVFSKDGQPIRHWGSKGSNPDQLIEPVGICVHDGKVYVADVGNRRIQVYSTEGASLASWPVVSGWREFFTEPYLTVSPQGLLVVSDSRYNRLQAYDLTGQFVDFYGMKGAGPGDFDTPIGVQFSPEGKLLVGDVNNNRIQKLEIPPKE